MTEAELVEHAQMAFGNAIAAFTVIFTMLSAYLVVAYFVGKKLSFSQVAIINTFFTISVVWMIFSEVGFFAGGIQSTLEVFDINPSRALMPLHPSMPLYLAGIDFLILAACLKFMWDIRHPKTG